MAERIDHAERAASGSHPGSSARPSRARARLLAVGSDLRRLRLLRAFLDCLGPFECTAIGSAGPGLNALVGKPWAAAVVVDDLANIRTEQLIATARGLGNTVPIVGLVMGYNPARTHALYQAGATEVVSIDGSPLAPMARAVARVVERQQLLDRVAELERSVDDRHPIDLETGCHPGWRFDEALVLEAARTRRRRGDLGLLELELRTSPPHDRLPTAERAVVLRRCASLLRNAMREGDLLGHDGSGRFRALLVDTGPMGAEDAADVLRRAVKVGFDGSGLTAQVQVESHDAQGDAAQVGQPTAA